MLQVVLALMSEMNTRELCAAIQVGEGIRTLGKSRGFLFGDLN